MKNKYILVGAIISVVVALDQWTKHLVETHINRHEMITVIPGFFNLTNVRNSGAAFGILSGDRGLWRMVFFVAVTLIALGVIAVLIRKTQERLLIVAFSLIAGGAIGNNLIDRIRIGEVVDFIEWYYKSFHWPSFNIADSAITIGVGLLVIDMLFIKKTEGASTKS